MIERDSSPSGPAASPVPSEEPPVTIEGYNVYYADMINVAMNPVNVALTFYVTVPDPSVMEGKGAVRCAQAIVQIPLAVAAQLPRMINQSFLSRLDVSAASPESLEVAAREMQEVADQFKRLVEQARSGAGTQ